MDIIAARRHGSMQAGGFSLRAGGRWANDNVRLSYILAYFSYKSVDPLKLMCGVSCDLFRLSLNE